MYLNKIIGTSTKVNALYALLRNPQKAYIEKDLAREADTSISEINRQLPDLVAAGLVSMERVGKIKRYQINTKHFLYRPLRNLFEDLNKIYREIGDKITQHIVKKQPNVIQAVILMGSLVRGEVRSDIIQTPSDIDLLFVVKKRGGEIKNLLLDYINHTIVPEYGIACYPIVLTVDEYKKGLKNNSFVIEAHANGEVLYGEKPKKFG